MLRERVVLSGRRIAAPFFVSAPITITNAAGELIAELRSPRKLAGALASGELILLPGDVIHVRRRQ